MAASVSALADHSSPLLDPLLLTLWLILGAVVLVLAAVLVSRANRRFSGRLDPGVPPTTDMSVSVPAQAGPPVLLETVLLDTEVGIA